MYPESEHSMSNSNQSPLAGHSSPPVIRISYECLLREQLRESTTVIYEVACSIVYPAPSAHLSLRVTGQNTYRNMAAKEVPFTRHETGATAYLELLEAEQLEVRIVEVGAIYSKVIYCALGRELTEQNARWIDSIIQRIDNER